MAACVSGVAALADARHYRQEGLSDDALGVKWLQVKQEDGSMQRGDAARADRCLHFNKILSLPLEYTKC